MTLLEIIKKRQSYRGAFTDVSVSREDLQIIVQSGLDAPSGVNAQTTEFVIVDDPDLRDKIQGMHPNNKAMQQAQAYILCIIDKDPPAVYEGLSFQIEDCAAAVENMLLTIVSLGYATVWIDGWLRREGRAQALAQWIDLPSEKQIRIILPIGKPAEEYRQPTKKPFQARAWFNHYQD